MKLDFILDEDYLAFFILQKKMYNESKELEEIKAKLDSDLGYKKILGEESLNPIVYLKDDNIKKLVDEFMSTSKFNEIYKLYEGKNKESLAIAILNNTIFIEDNELFDIKNDLWDKYTDGYSALLSMNSFNVSTFLLDEDVKRVINNFKNTDEFKKLYKETKLYLESVKKYWQNNKEKINDYLKSILKMSFNKEVVVYITHPNTCEGYSFGDNKIVWGHYKGINNPNYNLIYLTHEWLHSLLPFTSEDTEIDCYIKHAIIELIADYELCSMLEGNSTLSVGHSYLGEYKKFLYPYWLKYIDHDNNISDMNIEEFIKYCSERYLKIVNCDVTRK